jgi:hypothetical protein
MHPATCRADDGSRFVELRMPGRDAYLATGMPSGAHMPGRAAADEYKAEGASY